MLVCLLFIFCFFLPSHLLSHLLLILLSVSVSLLFSSLRRPVSLSIFLFHSFILSYSPLYQVVLTCFNSHLTVIASVLRWRRVRAVMVGGLLRPQPPPGLSSAAIGTLQQGQETRNNTENHTRPSIPRPKRSISLRRHGEKQVSALGAKFYLADDLDSEAHLPLQFSYPDPRQLSQDVCPSKSLSSYSFSFTLPSRPCALLITTLRPSLYKTLLVFPPNRAFVLSLDHYSSGLKLCIGHRPLLDAGYKSGSTGFLFLPSTIFICPCTTISEL